jgi:hypothetical protein
MAALDVRDGYTPIFDHLIELPSEVSSRNGQNSGRFRW